MTDADSQSLPTPRSGSVLLRIVWMAAVPAILLCILLLAHQEPWTLGRYDAIILLLLAAAVGARALDAMRFGGTTADGRPATRSHVIGYSLRVGLLATGTWLVAQSIAI